VTLTTLWAHNYISFVKRQKHIETRKGKEMIEKFAHTIATDID